MATAIGPNGRVASPSLAIFSMLGFCVLGPTLFTCGISRPSAKLDFAASVASGISSTVALGLVAFESQRTASTPASIATVPDVGLMFRWGATAGAALAVAAALASCVVASSRLLLVVGDAACDWVSQKHQREIVRLETAALAAEAAAVEHGSQDRSMELDMTQPIPEAPHSNAADSLRSESSAIAEQDVRQERRDNPRLRELLVDDISKPAF